MVQGLVGLIMLKAAYYAVVRSPLDGKWNKVLLLVSYYVLKKHGAHFI